MAGGLREQLEGWASAEPKPAYVVDPGDRVLALGIFHVRGDASGVQLEQELAQLVTLREGLVERDQAWFSWEEGLRAAGLDPDAVALARRRAPRQAATSAE